MYEIPLAEDGLPDWNKIMDYDETTGRLFWKIKVSRSNEIGGSVESFDKINGYYRFRLGSKFYRCNRVIWYIMTGERLARNQIVDHIDHDRTNNRFNNLRVVSHLENNRNAKLNKNNKSGLMGVYFVERILQPPYWRVHIGKELLGKYDSFFEACCARKSAENNLEYHKNHGKMLGDGALQCPEETFLDDFWSGFY